MRKWSVNLYRPKLNLNILPLLKKNKKKNLVNLPQNIQTYYTVLTALLGQGRGKILFEYRCSYIMNRRNPLKTLLNALASIPRVRTINFKRW